MGVGYGNGKIILFGEHSAVYGYPAVGIQLPCEMRVDLTPIARNKVANDWDFARVSPSERKMLVGSVDSLARLLGRTISPHRVEISGDLPLGVGFGSSAAFCVAMIRALDTDGVFADRNALWTAAHDLEHAFHGTPSGIDTGLSILPGAHAIYPDPPAVPSAEQVTLPRMSLVVGAIDRSSSTADLVRGISIARNANPDRVDATLSELGAIAQMVIRGAPRETQGAAWFGQEADRAHELLSSLGLTTPDLNEALVMLRRAGSTGGKLSGAGGGGAFYAVFERQEDADAAAIALRRWISERRLLAANPPFVKVVTTGQ